MENKGKSRYVLVAVAMACLIGICYGMLINIGGLFFTPIADEFGVGRGTVALTLTITTLVEAVAGVVVAKIINVKNFKLVILAGLVLTAGGSVLLAVSSNLMLLYVFSAARGFGGGLIGAVTVTKCINNWFNERRGTITSLAMGFSGIVGAVVTQILNPVITSSGWRTGYMVSAGIILVLGLPSILFPIAMEPQKAGMEPLGGVKEAAAKADSTTSSGSINGVLYGIMIIYAILVTFTPAIVQHFPGLATSYGMSEALGATMLSICMIVNTVGKIVFGLLNDAIGTRRSLLLYSVLIIAGFLLIMLLHSGPSLLTSSALIGLAYTLSTVGVVMLVQSIFGTANYGRVYPVVNLCLTIANAFGTSVIGYLYDFSGGYILPLTVIIAFLVGSVVLQIVMFTSKNAALNKSAVQANEHAAA